MTTKTTTTTMMICDLFGRIENEVEHLSSVSRHKLKALNKIEHLVGEGDCKILHVFKEIIERPAAEMMASSLDREYCSTSRRLGVP